ncbi:hypothetical protein ACIO6T_41275 [Streptomyces sp. NPDC087532]|uniref:hypothetical protein n=1 Tax=unclassified Streptomyces TaxID=2593676 RepID=UPI0034260D82
MSAVDEGAEARRLADEDGLSQRQIAKRLGVSRYRVGRLLADQARPVAGPVADQARPVAEPADHAAALVAVRPTAVADQVADGGLPGSLLVIDLDRYPGLAEDLDLLRCTGGATAQDVVNFAVDRLACAYRHARARGLLHDGQAFDVAAMWLNPDLTATHPSP